MGKTIMAGTHYEDEGRRERKVEAWRREMGRYYVMVDKKSNTER